MNVSPSPPFDIAIIGGGAAGTMTAIHALGLAPASTRIALIESAAQPARGVAYATTAPEHRLNVPVGRMSAFPDRPADFLEFMLERHNPAGLERAELAGQYAQRRHYADYLDRRLQHAIATSPASLTVLRDRVLAIDPGATEPGARPPNGPTTGGGPSPGDTAARLRLESGGTLVARRLVLAVGNAPRPLPARGAAELPAGRCLEAWQYDAVRAIPPEAAVAIVGSGLSMVDVALSLAGNGHRGPIHVLSRHALLPLPHAASHDAADFDPQVLLAQSLRQRLRTLRAAAADAGTQGLAWQAVMERVRPLVQPLWQSLSDADQRRFLRHAVRQWDVHRHRIAIDIHALIARQRETGQLQLHSGRLQSVSTEGGRVRVRAGTRSGTPLVLDVDQVVNATGVEMRASTMRNPVLQDLLAKGLAVPGPHGIGIDTDGDGRVIDAGGQPQLRLFALGSLRIGRLWESLAVPELRGQAEAIARRLLNDA